MAKVPHQFLFEPGVFDEPWLVARGGVRQREVAERQILLPRIDGIAQRRLAALAQIAGLRIPADQQGQGDVGQMGVQPFVPAQSALRRRRVIAGRGFARIAKTHRDNGDFARIVELRRGQTKPIAQPVA